MFSCEFDEISKNIFFTEHLRTTASGNGHCCFSSKSFLSHRRSSTKFHKKTCTCWIHKTWDVYGNEFTNLPFYKTISTKNLNWKYPTFVFSYFWDILRLNALRNEKRKSGKNLSRSKKNKNIYIYIYNTYIHIYREREIDR